MKDEEFRDEVGQRVITRLMKRDSQAEWELDLKGLDKAHAEASVARMLERSRFKESKAVVLRLDPPVPGGQNNLFQPLGKLLLGALRQGWVRKVNPLDAGAGFYVELTGRIEKDET
ncbi:hypothetical protein ACTL6U_11465 [Rhodovibrionaceae bacterium A322]